MAAREDQLEPLVGNHSLLVGGERLHTCEQLGLAGEGLLTANPVDRPVPRGCDDPGAGVPRRPLPRPQLGSTHEGVLDRVLGEVEVAEDASEDRDAARTFVAVGAGEVVYAPFPGCSTTGRTSIVPEPAAGMRAAQSIASSSESASMR